MSGLKKVSGISTAHHRAVKLSRSTTHAKAPKMPKPDKTAVPKMARIRPAHGVAGTSKAHHGAQVIRAMSTAHVPRARGGAAVPGVPIGNPAPGPANAFE